MQPPPLLPFQVFSELTDPHLQNRNVLLSCYQIQVTCHMSQHITYIFIQLPLFCILHKTYFNTNWHFLNVCDHTNAQGPIVDGAKVTNN